MATESLKIKSYNCKNFSTNKYGFIKQLFKSCELLLLQEHCLFESMFDRFCEIDNSMGFTATSAMDESLELRGRPHGGCVILWKSNVNYKVEKIEFVSKRVCAVNMTFCDNVDILVFNVYMPCDQRRYGEGLNEYIEILNEISCCIHKLEPTYYVIGGHLNTDFGRVSPQTDALRQFMNIECCSCKLLKDDCSIDYTYSNADGSSCSILDHILTSINLEENIHNYCTVDSIENFSDHVAISCSISIPVTYFKPITPISVSVCQWSKADKTCIANYKNELDILLYQIELDKELKELLNCSDYSCTIHSRCIDKFYNCIIDVCIKSGAKCIPQSGGSPHKNTTVPHWNQYVEPHRERAMFWHTLWKENGSPRTGIIADIRRQTRAKYHYIIRSVRRNEINLRNEKLAEYVLSNDNINLWKEIKRVKGKANYVPCNIDNVRPKKINYMFLRHCPRHFQPLRIKNFYCIFSIHIEKSSIHRELSV